jgi:uncharacterized protein (DUF2126 family)
LTFDLADLWLQRSLGGCQYHVSHPGGLSYERFPINSFEAESRRLSRFFRIGHTPASRSGHAGAQFASPEQPDPDFPFTLDLRLPK